MVNIHELRIGNIVYDISKDKYVTVESLTSEKVSREDWISKRLCNNISTDLFNPVLLNNEILNILEINTSSCGHRVKTIYGHRIFLMLRSDCYNLQIVDKFNITVLDCKVIYLNQLQNMIYSIIHYSLETKDILATLNGKTGISLNNKYSSRILSGEDAKNFYKNLQEFITGNISKEQEDRIDKFWKEVYATYDEYVKTHNGKKPIV